MGLLLLAVVLCSGDNGGVNTETNEMTPATHPVSTVGEEETIKQIIVLRTDLGMRKGKMVAQGAHASVAFLARRLQDAGMDRVPVSLTPEQRAWLEGRFTKICVGVGGEEELLAVYEQARAAGLEVHLITDSGATEFHGVPTRTALAVGPERASLLQPVTGHLRLL
jgi:peptidyl-tRNA hydrolase, PTH2 family